MRARWCWPNRRSPRPPRVDAGELRGPLAGVPITVKDHVWLAGAPATNGSRALAGFVAPADAACVARLRAAGAVVVAKTNNPEFCYRGVTDNEQWGLTRNPRDLARTPGGSSGGAAASVAAGMVPLAVGTDGGGSIRIPSAFCGVPGLKPTFGLVPKLPGFRGWPTLSVTGPIAASVRDLALALSVMAGPSAADELSFPYPGGYLGAVAEPSWAGLRVAVSTDFGFAQVDDDVVTAFRAAVDAIPGVIATEDHPEPADPGALWDTIALAEGFASEGPLLARNRREVGADAAAIVEAGASVTAVAYLDAQSRRGRLYRRWAEFFDHYDVVLSPAMPVTAFETGRLGAGVPGRPAGARLVRRVVRAGVAGQPVRPARGVGPDRPGRRRIAGGPADHEPSGRRRHGAARGCPGRAPRPHRFWSANPRIGGWLTKSVTGRGASGRGRSARPRPPVPRTPARRAGRRGGGRAPGWRSSRRGPARRAG